MRGKFDILVVALVVVILSLAPWARAQPAEDQAIELADRSFSRGRALFERGRLKEAAREFEASWRFDPSPGTLLNLAACHEALGELSLALGAFERAASDARRAPDPKRRRLWLDAARQSIEDLRKRVPILVLRGVEPGSSLTLDGSVLETRSAERGSTAFEVSRRVNPGQHVLRVSAPGKHPVVRAFAVEEGARSTLVLPSLEPYVGSPAAPAEPALDTAAAPSSLGSEPSTGSTIGPWPLVLGGTGGALLVSSAVTGWLATSKSNELRRSCPGDECPESRALEATRDSGRNLARATDLLLITGALCAGVGVTLFVLESREGDVGARQGATTALRAGCFGEQCGVLASGRF
jgi:hypothetical protein